MFGVTKDELIQGLENLRLRLCCYSPQPTCDCKYGIPWIETPTEEDVKADPEAAREQFQKIFSQHQNFSRLGEQTGCPELRQVIALLQVMPEDKFQHLTSRAHITITDDSFTESLNNALKARGKYEIVAPSSSEKFMCASCKISYDKTDVISLPPNMIYCKDCLIGSIQSAIDELGVKEELPKPIAQKVPLIPDEPDKMVSAIFNKLVDGLPTIQLTSREVSEVIQAIKPVIEEYTSHGFD